MSTISRYTHTEAGDQITRVDTRRKDQDINLQIQKRRIDMTNARNNHL